jgi:palmitoyltransferase
MPSRCSTKQIPFIAACIALIVGGIFYFAFPIRNLFEKATEFQTTPDDRPFTSVPVVVPVVATVMQGLIYLLACSSFFLSSFVDPGIYPRELAEDEDDYRAPLYKTADINGMSIRMKWCETCHFYRPPRVSHCSICDNCVEQFDHHCPWVDNCIGKRNYKYFFVFVNSLTLFIVTGYVWGIIAIVLHRGDLTKVIVEFILIVVGLLVLFPVGGLAMFHIVLVCMGRTTNEHVTGKFNQGYNPYNRGGCRNCVHTLCAPKYPRYMHYEMKYYTVGFSLRGPSPAENRMEDNTIRVGCISEGVDHSEMSTRKVTKELCRAMSSLHSMSIHPL